MGRWYEYGYFPPSRPRAAKGGIKAQSTRGTFGDSWWAKRWIAVLEGFNIGARLGRGRSYARNGQVLSIKINKGAVTAKVQGSRPKPYEVAVKIKVLSQADWKKLAQGLSRQALLGAKLLAGEMPQDIEQVFKKAGLSLFPAKLKDLETDCSCPDWSNPCKHIAAVYYLLGEEFHRDPFLIFTLRGMSRGELVGLMAGAGNASPATKGRKQAATAKVKEASRAPTEPLTSDPPEFWTGGSLPDDLFGEVRIPSVPAILPKRLGNFPFWRGAERLLSAVEPIYTRTSMIGLDTFLGERQKVLPAGRVDEDRFPRHGPGRRRQGSG